LAAGGGALVSGLIDKGLSSFATGGLIGGKSHSQGGTLIEAEKGEFIVKKDAVNKIGIENLQKINNLVDVMSNMRSPVGMFGSNLWTKHAIIQGRKDNKFQEGGLISDSPMNVSNMLSSPSISEVAPTQITVNVSAPLVDETVIDSIIPAIEKAQRLNLA